MKGRMHFIKDDLSGTDKRWPLFLRAAHYTIMYELEVLLERHAEFNRRFPEKR